MDVRRDFPVLDKEDLAYLDTAATSLTPRRVLHRMDEYYVNYSANVHRGVYRLSHEATRLYEDARRAVAGFVNADADEIVFTRGASSALNLVAKAYEPEIGPGDEILISELEHHSNLLPWQQLAKRTGATLTYIPLTEEGRITVQALKSVLTRQTKLVAITHVSNVMGYETPVRELSALAHEKGATVIVDAAQSAPHMPLDVRRIDCDFLAFSSHKMLGPTGVGALYGKRRHLERLEPVEYGGDMVEETGLHDATWQKPPLKFETGTPPIAEVIGFGEAVRYLEELGLEAVREHEKQLAEYTLSQLDAMEGITVYNPTTDSGIVTFNIDGVHPHDVVTVLDQEGVSLRAGHHCAQLVMAFLNQTATLRASFYVYNDHSDVDRLVRGLQKARDFFAGFEEGLR